MRQQARAYAFAGTAVFLWSTVPSAFKLSLRYVNPSSSCCTPTRPRSWCCSPSLRCRGACTCCAVGDLILAATVTLHRVDQELAELAHVHGIGFRAQFRDGVALSHGLEIQRLTHLRGQLDRKRAQRIAAETKRREASDTSETRTELARKLQGGIRRLPATPRRSPSCSAS